MTLLSVEQISKYYYGKAVVNNVSLSVDAAHIIGLLGANGSGKTTSFHIITGLISPYSGRILLNDTDITALSLSHRSQLGLNYLPQKNSIFRRFSVGDNLLAVLQFRRDLTTAERLHTRDRLLAEFNIDQLSYHNAHTLSGGEARKLQIARAVAMSPVVLLLDEPFAGVDPISIGEINHIITHLKSKGIGILITDHNVADTLNICDYTYIINEGVIIAQGDSAAIVRNEKVRRAYLGDQFTLPTQ